MIGTRKNTVEAEIVIVGAGPAGFAAAAACASVGKKAILLDDNPALGGQIWRGYSLAEIGRASGLSKRLKLHTDWMPEIYHSVSISDSPEPRLLVCETVDGAIDIRYRKLIIATGARERFIPFPGWTLPNVMGAGGLQALVKSGLDVSGKRIVVAGTGPLLLAVSAALLEADARVVAIVEQTFAKSINSFAWKLAGWPSKLVQAIGLQRSLRSVPYWKSSWVVEAFGAGQLETLRVRRNGNLVDIECDYLACGYHLIPNLELPILLGCNVGEAGVIVNELQETSQPDLFAAGEVTGIGGVGLSLVEGMLAGFAAAGFPERARLLFAERTKHQEFANAIEQAFALRDELRHLPGEDTIVCRCEDVRYSALKTHTEWRAAKLQTRCGMGMCQGRVCGPAVAHLFGWGHPGVRPPLVPVSLRSLGEYVHTETAAAHSLIHEGS